MLADARLKNEQATCPSCRTEISHKSCSRNLAVENAVLEMPIECQYCNVEFARSQVQWHENEVCLLRYVFWNFQPNNSLSSKYLLFSLLNDCHGTGSFQAFKVQHLQEILDSISWTPFAWEQNEVVPENK